MQLHSFWGVTAVLFGLLTLLGTTSGLVNAALWISEPLACALAGVLIGPAGFGLVTLGPDHAQTAFPVLQEAARFTLALAVTGAAMRLPAGWLRQNWRGLAVALGPGMLLMAAASAAIGSLTLGLSLAGAVLIGCALAPTDPVLSAPLVSGRLAARAVPARLRHALTAESGANDGLAYPLVLLPLIFISGPDGPATGDWVVHVLLWSVGVAIAVGAATGWVACRLLRWAAARPDAAHASLLTTAIALSVVTLAVVRLLGGDGILASFIAGVVLNGGLHGDAEERQERFNEALGRFFDLPVMMLFGVMLPWHGWWELGLPGLVFVFGVLLLRRLPAWLLLHRWMPWTRDLRGALFAGWFGPMGAAALFYALELQQRTGRHDIWPIISLTVAASVVVHGISGTPLTRLYGRIGFRQSLDVE